MHSQLLCLGAGATLQGRTTPPVAGQEPRSSPTNCMQGTASRYDRESRSLLDIWRKLGRTQLYGKPIGISHSVQQLRQLILSRVHFLIYSHALIPIWNSRANTSRKTSLSIAWNVGECALKSFTQYLRCIFDIRSGSERLIASCDVATGQERREGKQQTTTQIVGLRTVGRSHKDSDPTSYPAPGASF